MLQDSNKGKTPLANTPDLSDTAKQAAGMAVDKATEKADGKVREVK